MNNENLIKGLQKISDNQQQIIKALNPTFKDILKTFWFILLLTILLLVSIVISLIVI